MPYIDKNQVAEIRKELKSKFPEFKFSVTRSDYSGVRIVILSGNIDFNFTYRHINQYHIDSTYTGAAKRFLTLILNYATKDQYELVNDADYGSVPNFYVDINVGDWDRPYKFIK
jgi:hypothetical protein